MFQSTRPARGATGVGAVICHTGPFFGSNPRAPRGARLRPSPNGMLRFRPGFNPRAPRGARRGLEGLVAEQLLFQSTRPAAGAGSEVSSPALHEINVSIHAPRAGRDPVELGTQPIHHPVSIHAPRAGSWSFAGLFLGVNRNLVSIHAPRAGRGARGFTTSRRAGFGFNPRAPRGARLQRSTTNAHTRASVITRSAQALLFEYIVSIHAPRAGRDNHLSAITQVSDSFAVSIHAPRAGRDGGPIKHAVSVTEFQSTRPARGATTSRREAGSTSGVSIHAPRAGRDQICPLFSCCSLFQSTRPARGATTPLLYARLAS